ncbi:MAG: glycogen debranching enzyme family protein [Nitrospirae bacterium]|nr:glycogen debranching enzyme family protein [Nitrospirota bacterium]
MLLEGLGFDPNAEWLEADGLGGFASGTVSGIRSRRYHALLLVATDPPAGRVVLVNGFDAWVDTPEGSYAITSQRYLPEVVHPDGMTRIDSFKPDPWPTWTFQFENGTRLLHELFVPHETQSVCISWKVLGKKQPGRLRVRPFLSGRDYHSLHHNNPSFNFESGAGEGYVSWRPYAVHPRVVSRMNGTYRHEPTWYGNFLYAQERDRGLDSSEDLGSPGVMKWDLSAGPAIWILSAEQAGSSVDATIDARSRFEAHRKAELNRRKRFSSPLHQSADSYLVRRGGARTAWPSRDWLDATKRGEGKTLVAGYPWFTDWGRDTFISLRGLCLATGRFGEAHDILSNWSDMVSEGMLPNRFPDSGGEPEFNSVDASLWFVVAVYEFLRLAASRRFKVTEELRVRLVSAVRAILDGYARGTRYGIHQDHDGLLACGETGTQLTWMDARVDGRPVTPRIGKPVEIQALWLNAVRILGELEGGSLGPFESLQKTFRARFWNSGRGCLFDVVDVDHEPGRNDAGLRPNQIFAVGGLPFSLLDRNAATQVVEVVENRLLTPMGLRTLAPGESGYAARYEGGVHQRDGAYHQGTVWPWLMGPFVEAWIRVRGSSENAKREARSRFLPGLRAHLDEAGLGHISEIADAEPPHISRGCPFQAWSLGEYLRLEMGVFAPTSRKTKRLQQNADL